MTKDLEKYKEAFRGAIIEDIDIYDDWDVCDCNVNLKRAISNNRKITITECPKCGKKQIKEDILKRLIEWGYS